MTITRTSMFATIALLMGGLLLTGCPSNGANGTDGGTDGGSNEDAAEPSDPTEEEFTAAAEPATEAARTESNPATQYVAAGMSIYTSFASLVDEWDGAEEYVYGDKTVTVERSDNTWTWVYSDDEETVVYKAIRESDRWSFTWTENDREVINGHELFGGRTGSITVYDDEDSNDPDALFEITWKPSADYHTEYIATVYSDGRVAGIATVSTSEDGSTGEWSYEDESGSGFNQSGSW